MAQNGAKFYNKLLFLFVLVILSVGKIESRRTSHGSSHSSSHSSGSHSNHGNTHHNSGISHSSRPSHTGGFGSGNTHHTNTGFGSGGSHHTNTGFGSGGSHHTNTGFGSGGTHHTNTGYGNTHTGGSGTGFGNTHTNGQHHGGLSSTHTVTGGIGFTNQGGPIRPTHINPVGTGHPSAPVGPNTGSSHTGGFGSTHSGASGIGSGNTHVNGQHNGGLSSTHTITGGVGFTNQGGPIRPTHVNPVGTGHPSAPVGPNTGSSHMGGFGSTNNGASGIGFGNTHANGQHGGGLSSTHTITGGVGFTNQGGPIRPSHVNPVGSGNPSAPVGPNTRPIGFEHLNNQHPTNVGTANHGGSIPQTHVNPVGTGNVHHPVNTPIGTHTTNNVHVTNTHITNTNTHHSNIGYHPYQAQTVVIPGGGIHYQPAVQLQYAPPVHAVHVIPLYQSPTYISTYPSYSSGIGLGHGISFLSGYLIGRASGSFDNGYHQPNSVVHHHDSTSHVYHHNVNDNDRNNQQQTNNYYTVHNHYQNREAVPTQFSVPGTDAVQCPTNTSDSLCVPNTNAICLKNETIMCVTNNLLTVPCGPNNTLQCVYSRIDCNGDPSCNTTANQTYIDFYVPCISKVTLFNNKVVDTDKYDIKGSYELCVTAIAEPKKVQPPVGATV